MPDRDQTLTLLLSREDATMAYFLAQRAWDAAARLGNEIKDEHGRRCPIADASERLALDRMERFATALHEAVMRYEATHREAVI